MPEDTAFNSCRLRRVLDRLSDRVRIRTCRTYMQMGSADPPGKTDEKLKKRKYAKKEQFSEYVDSNQSRQVYRERRYADHIFSQIYVRMHHFVVQFSKFSLPLSVAVVQSKLQIVFQHHRHVITGPFLTFS